MGTPQLSDRSPMHYHLIHSASLSSHKSSEREKFVPSKPLRIKHLLVNPWESIACGEKFRNPLILKNRGRGVGVTRLLLIRPKIGKQRIADSDYGVVNRSRQLPGVGVSGPRAALEPSAEC